MVHEVFTKDEKNNKRKQGEKTEGGIEKNMKKKIGMMEKKIKKWIERKIKIKIKSKDKKKHQE